MATILSVASIIDLGNASTYLSANYVSGGTIYGPRLIKPNLPVQIAFVTFGLNYGYTGGAETTASLRATASYAYWLYGKFQLEAQQIVNGAGGGSVVPTPSGGGQLNPYDWVVGATTSATEPLKNGDTSVILTRFIGIATLNFVRGNLVQNTTPPPDGMSTYYSWNSVTGLFTLKSGTSPFGAAQLGEQMRIFI